MTDPRRLDFGSFAAHADPEAAPARPAKPGPSRFAGYPTWRPTFCAGAIIGTGERGRVQRVKCGGEVERVRVKRATGQGERIEDAWEWVVTGLCAACNEREREASSKPAPEETKRW